MSFWRRGRANERPRDHEPDADGALPPTPQRSEQARCSPAAHEAPAAAADDLGGDAQQPAAATPPPGARDPLVLERRMTDQALDQAAQVIRRARRRTWALDRTVEHLRARVAYTGEIVYRDVPLNGHHLPLLVLSPRGVFVLLPTADTPTVDDYQQAANAAAALRDLLPSYRGEIRAAVVVADVAGPPSQWLGADGTTGIKVGARSIGQLIDLFDDPGPMPGDLLRFGELLTEGS